jgi:hypothetical protein
MRLVGMARRSDGWASTEILALRDYLQMVGANTRRVSAKMVQYERSRNLTVNYLVQPSVGGFRFPIDAEFPVTAIFGGSPQPARFGDFNVRKESIDKSFKVCHVPTPR